jgi:CheY-like chemotaxis protein
MCFPPGQVMDGGLRREQWRCDTHVQERRFSAGAKAAGFGGENRAGKKAHFVEHGVLVVMKNVSKVGTVATPAAVNVFKEHPLCPALAKTGAIAHKWLRDWLLHPRQAVKASVLLPSYGMYDSDNFALVPRSPIAVERAEPGAKRILSGMVADTLALARENQPSKPVLSVLIGGFQGNRWPDIFQAIIESQWGSHYEVRVACETNALNLLTRAQQEPVDLFILSVSKEDARPAHARLLASLKARHRKPILVWGTNKLAGADAYIEMPSWVESLLKALTVCLKPRGQFAEIKQTPNHLHRGRPLRIVMLDDEPCFLDCLKLITEGWFRDATILTFGNSRDAMQELTREDPDLFTTDINHVGLCCTEMLQHLAVRRVKYPIFVISASADSDTAKWLVRPLADQGLNLTLLPKPFLVDEFWWLLLTHIGLIGQVHPRSPQARTGKS